MNAESPELQQETVLGSLRKEKGGWLQEHIPWLWRFLERLKKPCPFLFRLSSLFYFAILIFLIGMAWMAYSLATNSFTGIYGWDYQSQYLTFTYYFHDVWRNFFKTGVFELYSGATYLGTDNIGSNAYYGLFDPFQFFCYLFPRSWIPQTFAIATIIKVTVGAFAMRAYGKYMGLSEKAARVAAVAYAFNGYLNFMVGFPSFVSSSFLVPLIFLGIEKTIRERKIVTLAVSLGLLGFISFFFLVVLCIAGVLYALFRYFQTIKTRNWKENLLVIAYGVLGFAIGIMISAFVLLPSLRESMLSGRTTSIGRAYLDSLKNAFKDQDFKTIFARLFEKVGDNTPREIMPLVAFFYPTCNYLYLPTQGTGYDAWTASMFCYTPMVILFFASFIRAMKEKKWSHLIAFALVAYLLFTDFAYFFFYAFSGDGYGRWYIVLVPVIIYYASKEIDHIQEKPRWILPAASLIALGLTALTWFLEIKYVAGKTFEATAPYDQTSYSVPAVVNYQGVSTTLVWLIYYQMGLVVIESAVMFLLSHKQYLWKLLFGFVAVEAIVCGNLSFIYGNSYSYEYYYNGGVKRVAERTAAFQALKKYDDSFYRAYSDYLPDKNVQMAYGYNGTSNFHSLYNYDVSELSRYSHIMGGYSSKWEKFGVTSHSQVWSGYYGGKRMDFDLSLGLKYYLLQAEGYGEYEGLGDNVPFGAKRVLEDQIPEGYRLYENPFVDQMPFGHAIDEELIYLDQPSNREGAYPNESDFYYPFFRRTSTAPEISRNERLYLTGAIVKEEQKSLIEDHGYALKNLGEEPYLSPFTRVPTTSKLYHTSATYYGPYRDGKWQSPSYFLEHLNDEHTCVLNPFNGPSKANYYIPDYDKLVYTPNGRTYFNDDPTGAYFQIAYRGDKTRIYLVGDNEEGTNQVLSYEYGTIATFVNRLRSRKNGKFSDNSGNSGSVFGFYPKGKVRYIVLCSKPSDHSGISNYPVTEYPSVFEVYYQNRSEVDAFHEEMFGTKNNLQNVSFKTDSVTFSSSFEKDRIVVTALGYDAGWHVKATLADGSTQQLDTIKLDGGFVGFFAPKGEVTYHMYYQTPYLKLGVFLSVLGIVTLCGVTFGGYLLKEHKRKKAEAELASA